MRWRSSTKNTRNNIFHPAKRGNRDMKASDKVILIIIVTIFGYLVLSHLVLHAKWKRGAFVNPAEVGYSLYTDHNLPAFKYLKLVSLSDCRLIPATHGRIQVEGGAFDLVK